MQLYEKRTKKKLNSIARRKNRVRKTIKASSDSLRLSVFRSLKHFYAQIVDDANGVTICSASDKEVADKKVKPIEIAKAVGGLIAKKALEKGVSQVVFDRGSYQYHGRVKAAADGARDAGLKF